MNHAELRMLVGWLVFLLLMLRLHSFYKSNDQTRISLTRYLWLFMSRMGDSFGLEAPARLSFSFSCFACSGAFVYCGVVFVIELISASAPSNEVHHCICL